MFFTNMRYVFRVSLISLSLWSYEILSGPGLPFYLEHIFYQMILNSVIAPITPFHTNDEWIVMKFIKIQINKRWFDQAWLIIHEYTFYGQWSPKYNSTNTRTINICSLNPGIYRIFCFFIKCLWISVMSLTSAIW